MSVVRIVCLRAIVSHVVCHADSFSYTVLRRRAPFCAPTLPTLRYDPRFMYIGCANQLAVPIRCTDSMMTASATCRLPDALAPVDPTHTLFHLNVELRLFRLVLLCALGYWLVSPATFGRLFLGRLRIYHSRILPLSNPCLQSRD